MLYIELARHAGLIGPEADEDEAVNALLVCIDRLLEAAVMPRSLSQLDIPRAAIAQLAPYAAAQWTAHFNPRSLTVEDFDSLYSSTWSEPDRLATAGVER